MNAPPEKNVCRGHYALSFSVRSFLFSIRVVVAQ